MRPTPLKVNQVELHVWLQQRELLAYHAQEGI
jgi:diketogulonate reductase-like aldo/keto reductase